MKRPTHPWLKPCHPPMILNLHEWGPAKLVIVKRPTEEEAEVDYENYANPITAAKQSQKSALSKFSEPKNSQPTARVTKPAARNAEKSFV